MENAEWKSCTESKSIDLGLCIYACKSNKDCEDSCVEEFKTSHQDCPCEANCPAGCPCESYDCDQTTTPATTTTAKTTTQSTTTTTTVPTTTRPASENSVMVLNTYDVMNKPLVIPFQAGIHGPIRFTLVRLS